MLISLNFRVAAEITPDLNLLHLEKDLSIDYVVTLYEGSSESYLLAYSNFRLGGINIKQGDTLNVKIIDQTMITDDDSPKVLVLYSTNRENYSTYIYLDSFYRNSFFIIPDWNYFENYFDNLTKTFELFTASVVRLSEQVNIKYDATDDFEGNRTYGVNGYFDKETGVLNTIQSYYNHIDKNGNLDYWNIELKRKDISQTLSLPLNYNVGLLGILIANTIMKRKR